VIVGKEYSKGAVDAPEMKVVEPTRGKQWKILMRKV
jgi:hypothetical protein